MLNAIRYILSMFPSVAIVNHVQMNDQNDTFYAQAELILAQDVSHARLQLEDVNASVHATVLLNAKAGRIAFDISGNGPSPFEVGDTIKVTCFEKGEVPS
jgi:hypothetical protein